MIEELVTLLRNKTSMGRFNPAEVEAVLTFLQEQGYLVDPNAPDPVITIPREEFAPEMPEPPKADGYGYFGE